MDNHPTITDTDVYVNKKVLFPTIPLYALRSLSGDDYEKFHIIESGVATEHLLQLPRFLRTLFGTILISYPTVQATPS